MNKGQRTPNYFVEKKRKRKINTLNLNYVIVTNDIIIWGDQNNQPELTILKTQNCNNFTAETFL